ncbi:TetR/AcrR family transcriptional regulator [Actinoplanes sp. NPDC051494]|uniref:TetR/AcrR family transcriptional regulator n=1 Tax=Actinoplanes sp. NPDC051494 TaxID=3363907 RepID=UPI0037894FD6
MATGRRAEYARATKEAIRAAAHDLFLTNGYFSTRVEDIARAARVAPATVYAVGGGKNGLLRDLIETTTTSPENRELLVQLAELTDPGDLLRSIVDISAAKFARWSPLLRQVYAAAPQEPTVQEALDLAHAGLRNGLAVTAARLAALHALKPGMTAAEATDILWFHLSNRAYFTLTDDLSWPLPRTRTWLTQALTTALLHGNGPAPREGNGAVGHSGGQKISSRAGA